jgi:hypothetical protein
LRAWIPGFAFNSDGSVPSDGSAWWKRQADRSLADGLAGAPALRTLGEIWMGEIENAEALLHRNAPSLIEAASFCILAYCNDAPETARRVWSAFAGVPPPESQGERLLVLCARALCEPSFPELLSQLKALNAQAPSLYERTWPSNPRWLYSALAHSRLGDRAGAREWLRRAETPLPPSDDLLRLLELE